MATGEKCDICHDFIQRGSSEWENVVETDFQDDWTEDNTFYTIFMCGNCANQRKVKEK